MKIERVNEENFSQAAEIYTVSWRESHREVCSPEFLKLRDCTGYLWKKIDRLYVISDPEPVGVFCLHEGMFSDLYIHPGKMRKGYGSACLKYAIAQCGQMRLTVLSSNQSAIALYQKLGFHFTGNDFQRKENLWEREMRYTENENG